MSDPDAPALSVATLLAAFDRHGVEYVIVGGVAAAIHGSARVTRDLDISPRWNVENLDRLARALSTVNARLRVPGAGATRKLVDVALTGEAIGEFEVSTWRTDHGDLGIVAGTPKLGRGLASYDDLLQSAAQVEAYGLTILVAGLDDLIESKRVLRRPPDLAALPELYELRDRRSG